MDFVEDRKFCLLGKADAEQSMISHLMPSAPDSSESSPSLSSTELRAKIGALEGENKAMSLRLAELERASKEGQGKCRYEEELEECRTRAGQACDDIAEGARREIEKVKADFYFILSTTEADLSASRVEASRLRRENDSFRAQLTAAADMCWRATSSVNISSPLKSVIGGATGLDAEPEGLLGEAANEHNLERDSCQCIPLIVDAVSGMLPLSSNAEAAARRHLSTAC